MDALGLPLQELDPIRVRVSVCLYLALAVLMICGGVFLFAIRLHRQIQDGLRRVHERIDNGNKPR